MKPMKTRMLSTTVIPIAVAAGFTLATISEVPQARAAQQVAQKGCNPCAAKRGCNPCAARKACNPRAAKRGCNPCAAKRACNPCAAKKGCGPCGPCGAKRACGPCGSAAEVTLTTAEANAVYDCLKGEMKTAYAKSGNLWAKWYAQWAKFSTQPYASATHGSRFVHNYASKKAAGPYGKFEKVGTMTRGGVLAKDSFTVTPDGKVSVGPLFLMEKMNAGFMKASNDWRYTLIMPNGQVVGTTRGKGSKNVQFCISCHQAVAEEQDAMLLIPEEYRAKK